jgi:hypothetical protein
MSSLRQIKRVRDEAYAILLSPFDTGTNGAGDKWDKWGRVFTIHGDKWGRVFTIHCCGSGRAGVSWEYEQSVAN